MTKAVIGIIGGSGVYDLPGLENLREEQVTTPWGAPSDALRFGTLGGRDAVFLPRHGRGHRLSPSGINYRANIAALKQAGVTDLVSISACGSYRAELYPGFFVLVDQFVDRTVGRESSFFGNGCVAHVSMAHPVAPLLQRRIAEAAKAEDIAHKLNGTYLCMEGPQFSSLAESMTYKAAGYDVVGMTAMPEAKLAREAEISYATVAMVTGFRLLASRARPRGRGERHQGRARECRTRCGLDRPADPRLSGRARSLPRGLGPGRSTMPSSRLRRRAIRSSSGRSASSERGCWVRTDPRRRRPTLRICRQRRLCDAARAPIRRQSLRLAPGAGYLG